MEQSKVPNPKETASFSTSYHQETPSLVQQIDSRPSLITPTNWDYKDALTRGYNVIVRKGTNRFKLFRFLLSRIKFSKDGFHLDDYLCFWQLYLEMIESKDPKFQKRIQFLQDEGLVELMNQLQDIRVFPYNPRIETVQKLDSLPLVYHSRSFFGMERTGWSKHYRLSFNSRLVRRRVPPVPYIGVGYKDKGSRRDVANDGSPSWQVVASVTAFKEREAEELNGPPPDSLEADP
jgi:hypothetical protein